MTVAFDVMALSQKLLVEKRNTRILLANTVHNSSWEI